MRYAQIRDALQTGDIVLQSGDGAFSALIKTAQFSRYGNCRGVDCSHAAVVYRQGDRVMLFEAIGKGAGLNSFDDQFKPKASFTAMSDAINRTAGKVIVRRVMGPRTQTQLLEAERFVTMMAGRPYETDTAELVRAVFGRLPGIGNFVGDVSSLFCSEAAAEFWRDPLKLLRPERPANTYTPCMFGGDLDDELDLMPGVELYPAETLEDLCS